MTQFEFSCPNDHSVKFTLEMCGRTAQCPKCSARFEVPTLEEVREMLGNDISPELEMEFQTAKKKLEEFAKAKAARQAQVEAQNPVPAKPHEFEFECPNHDPVKFTLEMCGHTAKCPKCGVRFDVPKLEEVREMLGDQIDATIEKEFKNAEIKYQEFLKAKAAKRAQLEKEAKEKAEKEEAEKEKAEQEAKEKAEREAKEKAEKEAKEKAEKEAKAKEEVKNFQEKELELETENPVEEMISFLCPNGHQLEAPVSSAGKKGKCPECGAKFKVPSVGTMQEITNNELELNPENELSLDENAAAEQTKAFTEQEAAIPPKITVSKDSKERPFLYPNLAIGKTGEIDLGLDEAIRSIPEALKMDPMAKFFWTLWTTEYQSNFETVKEGNEEEKIASSNEQNSELKSEKELETDSKDFCANIIGKSIKSSQAGKIEIQTNDGKVFRPIEFYEDKSLSPIGFFEALDENERSITLVIRWENVVRIVVKK